MSPDQFEDLLFKSTSQELREAVSGLDEKTRRSLSKTAQSAYSSITRNKAAKGASERVQKFVANRKGEVWDFWNAPINVRVALGLYAVAPLSGVKKQNLFVHGNEATRAMFGILEDRKPDWLGDWVAWKLEQEWHGLKFDQVHGWIKQGLMEKPDTPEYYSFYADQLDIYINKKRNHGVQPADYVPLSTRLHNDPLLLEDALSIFRCENRALLTDNWRAEHAHPEYESWSDALIRLVELGDLKREDLLDASLAALSEDQKNNQLSGNHKFHARLEPTLDELAQRETAYRELLAHPTGHVVKFALTQMAALDKAGRADRGALLTELQLIYQGAGIGNAKSALRLAGRIAKSDKKLHPAVLTSVIPALDHEDTGLQEAALKLITQYKEVLTEDHRADIERAGDFLAPSLKPQAFSLLGKNARADISPESGAALDTLLKEVQTLPLDIRKAYGLEGLAEDSPFSPRQISGDFRTLRVLHLTQPITPIENHDALYTAIAKALETIDSATEIELIIDGISRLGRNTSPDFVQRLDPLLKRMSAGNIDTSRGFTHSWDGLGHGVEDLVKAWITGRIAKRNILGKYYPHNRAAQPMIGHLSAIAKRVIKGVLQNRLSTPTHEGGWIDPRIWVDRAQTLVDSGLKSDVPDVCYSMLRLAPDYRDEAAKGVDTLPQPWRAVGRFLFGLDERPDTSVKVHPVIWLSAARARDPYADWSEALSGLHLTETAADGLRPAEYKWGNVTTETKPRWSKVPIKTTEFSIEAGAVASAAALSGKKPKTRASFFKRMKPKTVLTDGAIPTASLAANLKAGRWNGRAGSSWLFEWMTLLWPQNPSSIYARATYAFHLDGDASSWSTGHGYLNALFQANRPWGETGHLLMARGVASKNADIRGYVIDALIEGAESGQFDPVLFGSILEKMIHGGGVKLGRVAEALSRVAEISPLHAAMVSICLSRLIPQIDRKAHALSRLMEIWLESLAASGRTTGHTENHWLSAFKGASKSAKAAKKIEALVFNVALDKAVRAQALEARLALLP